MSERPLPDARQRSRPSSPAPEAPQDNQGTLADTAASDGPDRSSTSTRYPFSGKRLAGESAEEVLAAEDYFLREIDPEGGIESMLTYSMIDHTRQLNILENSKAIIIRFALTEKLVELMKPDLTRAGSITYEIDHQHLVNQWALGGRAADVRIREILTALGINLDHVLMNGYAIAFDKIGHLDVLIDRLERRRDRAVRTLQYTRASRPLVDLRYTQAKRMSLALAGEESRYLIDNASDGSPSGD